MKRQRLSAAAPPSLRGIAETMVKGHLQRVFEKIGTNRQAERVKLVAGYLSPLS
jgi:hypothetical protein